MEVGCCHSLDSCNFWSHSSRQNIENLEKIVLEVNLKRVFPRESNWGTALLSLYPNKLCRRAVVNKNDQIPRKRIEKQRWKGGRTSLYNVVIQEAMLLTSTYMNQEQQDHRQHKQEENEAAAWSEPSSFALLACIHIYRVNFPYLELDCWKRLMRRGKKGGGENGGD